MPPHYPEKIFLQALDSRPETDIMRDISQEPPMRPRNHLPGRERAARSRLAQLAGDHPLLKGSLVRMARACGNPRCRCARGEKHVSLYLSVRVGGSRKMLYIPPAWENAIRAWVEGGHLAGQLLDEISAACLDRFLEKKAKGTGPPEKGEGEGTS